ncbi:MAG: sulfatase-like hydrolase/transferase [Bacteroidetes bacterium]|jgi:uncharacterized sulfatase|nr:sulfatase-like hydrolase/transferase [Bacteroidota bacterium]
MKKNFFRKIIQISANGKIILIGAIMGCNHDIDQTRPPNILFCLTDDQSWTHTSIKDSHALKTPAFDRVAKEGVLFNNAYVSCPSCAPSRASIITGQYIYRLEEGGLLFGALPDKYKAFPMILRENGFHVGYTNKGYEPANQNIKGYYGNEVMGEPYNVPLTNAPEGIREIDYAAGFQKFLLDRKDDQPFFFWFGCFEPHRKYGDSLWVTAGISPELIKVPGFLPDVSIIREDMADYYYEIQWFDQQLQKMLEILEKTGELDNTIIIVTADNGMPFPRAKATLYEYGTHVPLAIRWGNTIKSKREVDDFIKNTDLAPTILDALNIQIPEEMNGKSFLDILLSEKEGMVDPDRNTTVTAYERHLYSRPGGLPYPIRAIRKDNWVYIKNFEPDRWPMGSPDFKAPFVGVYGDMDNSPSKTFMMENKNHPDYSQLFNLAFLKRPGDELYNIESDPYQLQNRASDPEYQNIKNELEQALKAYLENTNDPRMANESPWDNYPFYHGNYTERFNKPVEERDTVINGVLQ